MGVISDEITIVHQSQILCLRTEESVLRMHILHALMKKRAISDQKLWKFWPRMGVEEGRTKRRERKSVYEMASVPLLIQRARYSEQNGEVKPSALIQEFFLAPTEY